MKFLAVLFVLGISLVAAVPQSSGLDQSSDELVDEFIGSSDSRSPLKNLKDVYGQLKDHVKVDVEKLTEKAEKLLKKGSRVTGSIFDYLKNVSEKGKKKIVELFYRDTEVGSSDESASRTPRSFIPDIFRKIRDYLEKSDSFEKFKGLVGRLLTKGNDLGKQLLEILRTKGKHALINMSNRMLGRVEENAEVVSSRTIIR